MLKKAESNHELEAEKQDADKRLTEIREAKEALLKIHRDLLDAIKAEGEAAVILQEAISSSNNIIILMFLDYLFISALGSFFFLSKFFWRVFNIVKLCKYIS